MDQLACLKYLSSDERSGLAKTADIARHMRQFKCRRKERGLMDRGLYFVKADIKKCYDSINRELLIQILWTRIAEMDIDEFVCWILAAIMSGKDKLTTTYNDHVDVMVIINYTLCNSLYFNIYYPYHYYIHCSFYRSKAPTQTPIKT